MAKPDQWMALAMKMSSDPRIQRKIADAFFQIATSNPALGRRLLDGDPQAVMETYQLLVRNGGSVPLPAGAPRLESSPIGPGETVGGVSGPGVAVPQSTALVPANPRGLPHDPSQTRALTTTGGQGPDALESAASDIPLDAADDAVENALIPVVRGPGVRVGGLGGPPVRYGTRGKPAVIDVRPVPASASPPGRNLPPWAVPVAAGVAAAGGAALVDSLTPDDTSPDSKLEAAAAPILGGEDLADNAVKGAPGVITPKRRTWRDMTDEEIVNGPNTPVPPAELPAWRARYTEAFHNMTNGQSRQGRVDQRQYNYNRDTGLSPEEARYQGGQRPVGFGASIGSLPDTTVSADGYVVPSLQGAVGPVGDGQFYRLGDENAAKEAEADARRAEWTSRFAKEDLNQYGTRQLYQYRRDQNGNIIPGRGVAIPTTGIPNDPALVMEDDGGFGVEAAGRKHSPLTPDEITQQQLLGRRRDMEYREVEQNKALRPRTSGKYEEMMARGRAKVAARAELAGGSQNLNSGNNATVNALLRMTPEQRARQESYMMPGGVLAAQVDAQNQANAGKIAQQVVTGMLANMPQQVPLNPLQQQQLDANKPVQTRAREAVQAGRFNDLSVTQHANDIVNRHYSVVYPHGNSSDFTDNEVDLAAQKLADDTGMPFAQARKVMLGIQNDRRRNMSAFTLGFLWDS